MTSSDRDVLVAFYLATGGSQWTATKGWNTSIDISSWYGVTVRDGRVVKLSLGFVWVGGSINLRGPIPKELGQLSFLEELILSDNNLEGPIPKELAALKNLTVLNLSSNQLTGPIPEELAALKNLKVLRLSRNQLTGPIPKELAQLTSLERLHLYDNQLYGPIPQELAGLKKTKLMLWGNKLTGLLKTSSDREVLLALYQASGGHQWRKNGGWDTGDDISMWYGVEARDGRVVRLDLKDNNLEGNIPSHRLQHSPRQIAYHPQPPQIQ